MISVPVDAAAVQFAHGAAPHALPRLAAWMASRHKSLYRSSERLTGGVTGPWGGP